MNKRFVSESKEGRWAGLLAILFIVIMVFKILVRFPLPTPAIAIIGFAGLILGVLSFVKNRDRSILTLFAVFTGIVIVVWTVAEIAFPH